MAHDLSAICATLERTPAILEALVAGTAEEALRRQPAADRWSVDQVLRHLLDVEVNALGLRARRIVEEDDPFLPDYDQEALDEGDIAGPLETLARFKQERGTNLSWIQGLPFEVLERTGRHQVIGEISLWNHLNQWAFHDLGHVRQVAELQRAHLFYPHTGNYHKFYSVNP